MRIAAGFFEAWFRYPSYRVLATEATWPAGDHLQGQITSEDSANCDELFGYGRLSTQNTSFYPELSDFIVVSELGQQSLLDGA